MPAPGLLHLGPRARARLWVRLDGTPLRLGLLLGNQFLIAAEADKKDYRRNQDRKCANGSTRYRKHVDGLTVTRGVLWCLGRGRGGCGCCCCGHDVGGDGDDFAEAYCGAWCCFFFVRLFGFRSWLHSLLGCFLSFFSGGCGLCLFRLLSRRFRGFCCCAGAGSGGTIRGSSDFYGKRIAVLKVLGEVVDDLEAVDVVLWHSLIGFQRFRNRP